MPEGFSLLSEDGIWTEDLVRLDDLIGKSWYFISQFHEFDDQVAI